MRTRLIGRCGICYDTNLAFGPLAQLGERLVRNQEVGGSIPPRSTNLKSSWGPTLCLQPRASPDENDGTCGSEARRAERLYRACFKTFRAPGSRMTRPRVV